MAPIEYPKPLPRLIFKSFVLESGFTTTEVVALQNGWRLTKNILKNNFAKLFAHFFSENYLMLERFRDPETEKFKSSNLYEYTQEIVNIYGRLIDSGLSDMAFIKMCFNDLTNIYILHGITYNDVEAFVNFIKQCMISFLDRFKSPTLLSGLEKLCELINVQHRLEVEMQGSAANE